MRISDNGHDFTRFNLTFTYEPPLFVTRIYPTSGDVGGGGLVTVTGGNFVPGVDQITCRFGDALSDATVLSTTAVTCPAPPLEPIREIQRVRVRSASLIPHVQRISVVSDPLRPTIQTVELRVDGANTNAVRVPEIQEFHVFADSEPAVQQIRVSAQAYSGEIFSVTTSIAPVVREIQVVRLRASTFIGGAFRLAMEGKETEPLTSYHSDGSSGRA